MRRPQTVVDARVALVVPVRTPIVPRFVSEDDAFRNAVFVVDAFDVVAFDLVAFDVVAFNVVAFDLVAFDVV